MTSERDWLEGNFYNPEWDREDEDELSDEELTELWTSGRLRVVGCLACHHDGDVA